MKLLTRLAFASAFLTSATFQVQAAQDAAPAPVEVPSAATAASTPASSAPMSEGEVRKVNKDAEKITIRHGELHNLGMPPMTMVFQVKDAAMLDLVKAGDKIRFIADKIGGRFTVMELEVSH